MISQLTAAITKDVLEAKRSGTKLSSSYPASLRTYVEKTADEDVARDLKSMTEVLGDGTSLLAAAPRLLKEGNGLLNALLDALSEMESVQAEGTALGSYRSLVREAGSQYERVLIRELQALLLVARDIDSPLVQVAQPLPASLKQESRFPGVPLVTVNRSLLGGLRIFHNGQVQDASWRARLTKVLSAVVSYE